MTEINYLQKDRKIGFTGTRNSLTNAQESALEVCLIQECQDRMSEVHHGDCVGADSAMHDLAKKHGIRVVIHPPNVGTLRAYKQGDEVLPPLPYLERNRDIVDSCSVLIACPDGPEKLRSGTWSTIRYARRRGVPVLIVYPDGRIERKE